MSLRVFNCRLRYQPPRNLQLCICDCYTPSWKASMSKLSCVGLGLLFAGQTELCVNCGCDVIIVRALQYSLAATDLKTWQYIVHGTKNFTIRIILRSVSCYCKWVRRYMRWACSPPRILSPLWWVHHGHDHGFLRIPWCDHPKRFSAFQMRRPREMCRQMLPFSRRSSDLIQSLGHLCCVATNIFSYNNQSLRLSSVPSCVKPNSQRATPLIIAPWISNYLVVIALRECFDIPTGNVNSTLRPYIGRYARQEVLVWFSWIIFANRKIFHILQRASSTYFEVPQIVILQYPV